MYVIGETLRVKLFGRSHADRIGCIIEGVPPGTPVDENNISKKLDLRRPSHGIGTERREPDIAVIECGVKNGKADGTPILVTIENKDVVPGDYEKYRNIPRPGHADLPASFRLKDFDIAGGGQFSGRMTAPLVVAGAVADGILSMKNIKIAAYASSIGKVVDACVYDIDDLNTIFKTRATTKEMDDAMSAEIESAKKEGDSVGGIIKCIAEGIPLGTGGLWFDALDCSIARAMFSIPGVKGVEFGDGFNLSTMKGSESNGSYRYMNGKIEVHGSCMGGVVGGMSDGSPLRFSVAMKPTPSIALNQRTIDLSAKDNTIISIRGRHDPCIVPRAVSVVEAMASLTIANQILTFPPYHSIE